jgi:predicted O-methyltransferase YrrM
MPDLKVLAFSTSLVSILQVMLIRALHYSRPGTLIVGDNVVRDGEVINSQSDDARVQGVRRFIEMIGDNPRLTATALQTVGIKGWDGFTLAIVKG